VLSGLPLTGLFSENVHMNRCNSTGFGQMSSFSKVCLIPIVLSAFQGLRGRELYVRAVQTGCAIPMQEFTQT